MKLLLLGALILFGLVACNQPGRPMVTDWEPRPIKPEVKNCVDLKSTFDRAGVGYDLKLINRYLTNTHFLPECINQEDREIGLYEITAKSSNDHVLSVINTDGKKAGDAWDLARFVKKNSAFDHRRSIVGLGGCFKDYASNLQCPIIRPKGSIGWQFDVVLLHIETNPGYQPADGYWVEKTQFVYVR